MSGPDSFPKHERWTLPLSIDSLLKMTIQQKPRQSRLFQKSDKSARQSAHQIYRNSLQSYNSGRDTVGLLPSPPRRQSGSININPTPVYTVMVGFYLQSLFQPQLFNVTFWLWSQGGGSIITLHRLKSSLKSWTETKTKSEKQILCRKSKTK